MEFMQTVVERNRVFAENGFAADLRIIPSSKTIIIGCLDPRVDPAEVLGLQPGEAAIYRNIGGRVTRGLLETMVLLPMVAKAVGQEMGQGWNLIVLHHTDCGIIGCYKHAPDLLARHLNVTREELDHLPITDPYKAVARDVDALRASRDVPGGFLVSGIVYNISTGLIDIVVAPAMLRDDAAPP